VEASASGLTVACRNPKAWPRADFREDGFAVLPGLLDCNECVDSAILDAKRVLSAPRVGGCERPFNTLVPLRWNDDLVHRFLQSSARVAAIAETMNATDLRWISGYISVKTAHSPPLWWHQDWWCWNHPISFRAEAAQASMLCYLSQTGPRSAALRVIPGSHRVRNGLHDALPTAHGQTCDTLDRGDVAFQDHPAQRTLALRAGDAVVVDYRLLHGTHANHRTADRYCVVLNFAPSWSRLPSDIRAHLIQHPALPTPSEVDDLPDAIRALLPTYEGKPTDLAINRERPPAQ
jgi:hypothetical protein